MSIFLWDSEPSKIFVWDSEVSKVFVWDTQVRPSWPDKDYLCFTAEAANSKFSLWKTWSPTVVSLEISTNWNTWSDYTIWNIITLNSIWDKVYFRNKSGVATGFSTGSSSYYQFANSGNDAKIAASWDITSLLSQNLTNTLQGDYCFYKLFYGANWLTTPPSLPATTLTQYCYNNLFYNCVYLKSIPRLPATTLKKYCYWSMFQNCSSLKLSASQNSDYTQAYRIPTTWSGTTATSWNLLMFSGTWWTQTGNPSINTTYYVHKDNTII